eukprot:3508243-Pleurochrysis_carterae.AAC.8
MTQAYSKKLLAIIRYRPVDHCSQKYTQSPVGTSKCEVSEHWTRKLGGLVADSPTHAWCGSVHQRSGPGAARPRLALPGMVAVVTVSVARRRARTACVRRGAAAEATRDCGHRQNCAVNR